MSPGNSVMLAVIMERMVLTSKWADHRWEAIGVLPDAGGEMWGWGTAYGKPGGKQETKKPEGKS